MTPFPLHQLELLLNAESSADSPIVFTDSRVGLALIQLASGKDPGLDGWSPPARSAERAQALIAMRMLVPTATHYTVLGIHPTASALEIRENYRRLIALVHPDSRPSGFPADAAIQVNLAYSVLSDPELRERYDSSLRIRTAETDSATPNPARGVNPPQAAAASRGKAYSAILGTVSSVFTARKALIWMAAVLSLPLIYFLIAGRQTPEPTRLIEARPALKLEGALPNSAASGETASRSIAASDSSAALAPRPATEEALPPLKKSAALPERLLRPAVDDPMREPPRDRMQTMDAKLQDSPRLASTTNSADPVQVEKPQVLAKIRPVATDLPQAEPPRQRGHAKDELVGESLAQLVEAFEAGSTERLSRVLANGLVGRERIVSDFEQIFRGTRRRELRLLRIDQQAHSGPSARFSGVAEMAMTTLDGHQNQHRIFISGVTTLQQGRAVITQWSSYPVQ